jgi:hypothetical protein
MDQFDDYPKERLNPTDTNEDMVCFFCKTPVKIIQGKLENHTENCNYRKQKTQ